MLLELWVSEMQKRTQPAHAGDRPSRSLRSRFGRRLMRPVRRTCYTRWLGEAETILVQPEIAATVEQALQAFCLDFLVEPYLCYTEHGLHALF